MGAGGGRRLAGRTSATTTSAASRPELDGPPCTTSKPTRLYMSGRSRAPRAEQPTTTRRPCRPSSGPRTRGSVLRRDRPPHAHQDVRPRPRPRPRGSNTTTRPTPPADRMPAALATPSHATGRPTGTRRDELPRPVGAPREAGLRQERARQGRRSSRPELDRAPCTLSKPTRRYTPGRSRAPHAGRPRTTPRPGSPLLGPADEGLLRRRDRPPPARHAERRTASRDPRRPGLGAQR